jgi:hypothetical protein
MAANGQVEAGMENGEAADRNTGFTKISERKLARELREQARIRNNSVFGREPKASDE